MCIYDSYKQMKGKSMNKKQLMYDRINKHGEDLKRIFKLDPSIDPVKLCKQLFKLENKAHKLAEDYCNGIIYADDYDVQTSQILTKVENILKEKFYGFQPDPNCLFGGGSYKNSQEYLYNSLIEIKN